MTAPTERVTSKVTEVSGEEISEVYRLRRLVLLFLLVFVWGEAYQFDWSEDSIIVNDVIIKVKVAHFVLCYSRKKFTTVYPNETQEMVFDAHVRAFAYFGGVPEKGIYDNIKTAVTKVLIGHLRKFNPAFERLCAHYRLTRRSPALRPRAGRKGK